MPWKKIHSSKQKKKKTKKNPKRISKHLYTHARTHVFSNNYSYNILMVYHTRKKVPNLAISVKMSICVCVFTLLRNTFFSHSLSLFFSFPSIYSPELFHQHILIVFFICYAFFRHIFFLDNISSRASRWRTNYLSKEP